MGQIIRAIEQANDHENWAEKFFYSIRFNKLFMLANQNQKKSSVTKFSSLILTH